MEKYRHHKGRKVGAFDDVAEQRPIKVALADVRLVPGDSAGKLPVYRADTLRLKNSFTTVPKVCPNVFILLYRGHTYLINTEGCGYSRYCWPCAITQE